MPARLNRVTLTAPPRRLRCDGPAEVVEFFSALAADRRFDRIGVLATRANNQPAIADYFEDSSGKLVAHGVMVLTIGGDRIAAITGFDDDRVFPYFGLPRVAVLEHRNVRYAVGHHDR